MHGEKGTSETQALVSFKTLLRDCNSQDGESLLYTKVILRIAQESLWGSLPTLHQCPLCKKHCTVPARHRLYE